MTTTAHPDTAQLQAVFERAEQALMETAEAERLAYQRCQDAYGAYEVARDEATAAWVAWVEASAP